MRNFKMKVDILSIIREGSSQKPGIYYNEQNSYQNLLIEKPYSIYITEKEHITVISGEWKPIDFYDKCKDYYIYLYSEYGKVLLVEEILKEIWIMNIILLLIVLIENVY